MTIIEDQPPPVKTDRRPAWDLVLDFVQGRRDLLAKTPGHEVDVELIDSIIVDMRERDRIGRERYGVPLTAGNGRDHLVDAYQEALDMLVYLRAELDERDVVFEGPPIDDPDTQSIAVMFLETLGRLVVMQALIRKGKASG
jgi:hypothetical protein